MGETDLDLGSIEKRRTLWIVLWLNVAIAIGFFITGFIGDSSALIANGLDNSSDTLVYALSLLALTRSNVWKRAAARASGIMLMLFGIGVVADAIRRFVEGSEPGGALMMGMAAVAAVVNLFSLRMMQKMKNKDVHLRAATTFSFNDFLSNGGIIIAGIAVLITGANWPDLIVGVAVAAIALYGSIEILRDAHQDKHDEQECDRSGSLATDHGSSELYSVPEKGLRRVSRPIENEMAAAYEDSAHERSGARGKPAHPHKEHDDQNADHAHGGVFGANTELIFALLSGACLALGFGLSWTDTASPAVSTGLYLAAYVFGGFFTLREAFQSLKQRRFEIDTLMLVAAAGAAMLGEFAEGAFSFFFSALAIHSKITPWGVPNVRSKHLPNSHRRQQSFAVPEAPRKCRSKPWS